MKKLIYVHNQTEEAIGRRSVSAVLNQTAQRLYHAHSEIELTEADREFFRENAHTPKGKFCDQLDYLKRCMVATGRDMTGCIVAMDKAEREYAQKGK